MDNKKVYFTLVKAGLWKEVNENLNENLFGDLDLGEVQKLAEEQSVVGLVAAGLENLPNGILPLTEKLKFVGMCQLIEQRNQAMNLFVAELMRKLREADINAVLIKGQGIAQCYAKPLWRSSGDVDFLFDEANYYKAKKLIMPLASETDKEFEYGLHQSLTIGVYTVELHGGQRCGLSCKMDDVINDVQREVCEYGNVRTWMNGNMPVNLPAPDEDLVFVFTHFLKHFYKGGLGLRQICDWCRLLWIYRESIDLTLLESRLREMRLMSEWKAFGAFAVERLGMPVEAMRYMIALPDGNAKQGELKFL